MPIQVGVVDSTTFSANADADDPTDGELGWPVQGNELEAQWKLNETSGTSAADSTGHRANRHGDGHHVLGVRVLNNGFSFNGVDKDSGHRPDGQPAQRQRRRLGQI